VIGGQIHFIFDNMNTGLPHVKTGKLRALGITTLKRSPTAPEIPTISEAGLPGYEMASTSGFVVPAGVPRDIVLRLNAEINKVLRAPNLVEKFSENGVIPEGGTPEQYAQLIQSETAKWSKVVKAAGIKPE
jgi:tripartite-type tricarboxylate transporter receptor subunit TctC